MEKLATLASIIENKNDRENKAKAFITTKEFKQLQQANKDVKEKLCPRTSLVREIARTRAAETKEHKAWMKAEIAIDDELQKSRVLLCLQQHHGKQM